jgi:photosystem II stability/assembly factor-like uncharacterized protein
MRTFQAFLLACLFALLAFSSAAADQPSNAGAAAAPASVFKNLKFRDLGPATAGGRVTCIVGIPGNPNVYYVGTGGGGIFKTTDGGVTWKAIFEHEATASIGALALAPSNPGIVWAGTGEANIRNDVIDGDGVYLSTDAGHSWKQMGLADAGQISSVVVDPHDSNVVFVGVLGHAWAPNATRGVFRTTDGGKTWKKVLFVDNNTGVADLEMQPGNSRVLFAAMWQARRYPWTLINGGPGSGIYRSTDGGDTWQKLSKGLPAAPLGRIALAIAPTNPNHIDALIDAAKGMLWQSLDMGDHWTAVSGFHALDVRPFYFSRIFIAPDNEQKFYALSFKLMESDDGGKTARAIDNGVHPDHHALWIDPRDPNRIIQGNDGGVFLSTNGGKTWRFLDGMPIEQFYQVAVDSRSPYTICGGLQDNSGWCGPSSELGRRRGSSLSWFTVVGGDGEYVVPAPSDSNIIYGDAQNGFIRRVDRTTHWSTWIRPDLGAVEEAKPADLKYRFNWTAPIAVSRSNANEVYLGANALFKTTDGGEHWSPISGDLTRNDKSKQPVAGEPLAPDVSGAETYDTIISVSLAPTDGKVIWVGTDDGLVQVTRDGGQHWTNVTGNIAGAPEWATVYQIGVSPFDAGTAYAAFDAHKLDDRRPYVYRTRDYGQTWQKITNGLPAEEAVHVVREDPNHKGLLALGGDTGLYYSLDDGGNWLPLSAIFPTTPVYDLKFVKNTRDLVAATHGRGVLVLDDLRPLEDYKPELAGEAFHLFTPQAAIQYHHWEQDEGQQTAYRVANAPPGVVIDYLLKSEIKPTGEQKKLRQTPVKIVITDASGNPVSTFYGPSKAGINRAVWNMRYDGPERLTFVPQPPPSRFFNPNRGPIVVPGAYRISVTVNGSSQTTSAKVLADPNLHVSPATLSAQLKAALAARDNLNAVNEMLNRLEAIRRQINSFQTSVKGGADPSLASRYAGLLRQGSALSKSLQAEEEKVFNTRLQRNSPEDDIHYLSRLHGQLASLFSRLSFAYGQAPNAMMLARLDELEKQVSQRLGEFNSMLKGPIAAYNKAAYDAGLATAGGGSPLQVKTVAGE